MLNSGEAEGRVQAVDVARKESKTKKHAKKITGCITSQWLLGLAPSCESVLSNY